MDALSDDEKESLKKILPDLVRETPRARLAETRFKKLTKRVGGEGCASMRGALTPLYVKTVVHAAKSAAWRARSSAITR